MCKKTRNIILNTLSILWFVIILYPEQAYTKEQENDVWYAYEALTSRLGSEWYKIGVLKNDLASIRNILDGLRNLQLFPSGITRLNEDKIVAFDREIEKVEKKHLEIIDELNKLRLPLLDAISIVREMAVGDPVEDMFEVIKAGDIKRLSEILAIKHRIDILWKDVDQLIVLVNKDMGLSPFDIDSIYGLEKEFFEILKANLGLQSESYYKKMNVIKDSLVNRADNNGISQLYKIEIHQTKVLIKQKKEEIAKRNIISMKERYLDRRYTNELNILLTYIYFSLGDYLSTLETVKLLPDEPAFTTEKLLYTVQSWYALQEFNKAWQWGKSFDFTILKGKNRNIILWLVMESGLALDIEKDYSKFAEKMDNGSSYNLHIMHALARSYLRKGEPKIALSIFKKALKREPDIEVDKDAYHRIVLAKAQTLFETGDYQNALKLFFELLNTGHNFEEGLFGISLCYIQLDMYQKAETSLRKLINQSPQSPRSAEAILITAKRYISKARYEWKKTKYLTKEKKRLESILQELSVKLESVKDNDKKEKYKLAFIEIEDMLKRVNEEYIEDYSGIISYYTKALNICDLIPNHYETGSFQDVSFSEKRETLNFYRMERAFRFVP